MQLILIRHGESEANVNKSVYFSKADSLIELTEKGKEQAFNVGVEISKLVPNKYTYVYNSPYKRARDTKDLLISGYTNADPKKELKIKETVLLREQEHPFFRSQKERDIFNIRRKASKEEFFYKEAGYESYADVAQRVETFLSRIKTDHTSGDSIIVVAHEVVIRMFLMVLDNTPYENSKISIDNCELIVRSL